MSRMAVNIFLASALCITLLGVGYTAAIVNDRSDHLEAHIEKTRNEIGKLRVKRDLLMDEQKLLLKRIEEKRNAQ